MRLHRLLLLVSSSLALRTRGPARRGAGLPPLHAQRPRARFGDGMPWEESSLRSGGSRRGGGPPSQNIPVEAVAAGGEAEAKKHFYSRKDLRDIGVSEELAGALRSLKVDTPSRIQALAFDALSSGETAVVAEQTGSGKTLAYLAPLIQRLLQEPPPSGAGPRMLVLAPTAELAEQVFTVCNALLRALGERYMVRLRAMLISSGSGSLGAAASQLRRGRCDICVCTPGRALALLAGQGDRPPALSLSRCTSIVLDEVDVLLLDDSFGLQPIGAAARSDAQFVFVTATLPKSVLSAIHREFPGAATIKGPGLHRAAPGVKTVLLDASLPPNHRREKEDRANRKLELLAGALEAQPLQRTLIFCNTLESCRQVENYLQRRDRKGLKWRALAYHGAMKADGAARNLRLFSAGNALVPMVLVCTDRASRGMDFGAGRGSEASGVDHVVLFDFPRDVAEWVRRVGRTGRAGRGGQVTVVAYGPQLPMARELIAKAYKGQRIYDLPGEEGAAGGPREKPAQGAPRRRRRRKG